MTKKQAEYMALVKEGLSVTDIAKITGKNKSTISRTLSRATKRNPGVWFSVEDKLPPFRTEVLVVYGGRICTAENMLTWEDGHVTIYIHELGEYRPFFYWMPLPEPPKEG